MPPLIIIIVFMKRNCVRASSIFCFPSGNKLHCINLLNLATLKLPVFWWSRKLTSLRGRGASALPPLTIFHSLCICLAAVVPTLHSRWPSTTTMPTLLHTWKASARRDDALSRPNVKKAFPPCRRRCLANTAVRNNLPPHQSTAECQY